MKLYQVSLKADLRPPFRPADELHSDKEDEEEVEEKNGDDDAVTPVEIELAGIQQRVWEVPIEPGNYRGIGVNKKAMFWITRDPGLDGKSHLMAAKIENEKVKPKKIVEDVRSFEMSADGKKILVRKGDDLYVIDATAKEPSKLAEHKVDLDGWTFAINVREDWRQIFIDAWRMERDYFYDPGMHGVDWDGVRDKYLPLVDRVTTRQELSDLIGRFVGELSALHTSVRGGDLREGADDITVPALGARLERAADAGGYRIDYIYQSDPDFPDLRSPLADPFHGISEGDIIETVNGVDTLSVIHIGALLRNQEDKQVRLRIKPAAGGESRDVIVVPIDDEWSLRYRDWEYTRRLEVEEKSQGKIGYIHLRAMGSRDISAWYREFYPVFDRQAIVLDFRHNNGGNIDSIILEKLLRRAWFYWKDRVGVPTSNMQYAPRGHLVALCDQNTASDGEAVIEGFRRLGLGKIIGMRTWGGEIWLSSSNRLSDGGLARAPMSGVYADGEWLIEGHGVEPDMVVDNLPHATFNGGDLSDGGLARAPMSGVYADGEWLIEGHGVEPDMVVDNLPHATFNGGDAQLDAAIEYLLEEIRKDPREVPPPPPYPDKSFDYPEQQPGGGQS